ncbi:unnamed protein product [Adineta steineri]|nr:unnamed protein product [Adineta steineri]
MRAIDNLNYLRPLLTKKSFILSRQNFNWNYDLLDKMYTPSIDIEDTNCSEFRINPKHAISTILLGPGCI